MILFRYAGKRVGWVDGDSNFELITKKKRETVVFPYLKQGRLQEVATTDLMRTGTDQGVGGVGLGNGLTGCTKMVENNMRHHASHAPGSGIMRLMVVRMWLYRASEASHAACRRRAVHANRNDCVKQGHGDRYGSTGRRTGPCHAMEMHFIEPCKQSASVVFYYLCRCRR